MAGRTLDIKLCLPVMIVFSYSLTTFDFLSSVSYVIDPQVQILTVNSGSGWGWSWNKHKLFLFTICVNLSILFNV